MRARFLRARAGLALLLALPAAAIAASVVTPGGDAIPQIGATPGVISTTASTNCSNIKSAPAILFSLTAASTGNAANWIKVFDLAGTPSATNNTAKLILVVPSASSGLQSPNPIPQTGIALTNGLGICVTGGYAQGDNTNALSGHQINYSYK